MINCGINSDGRQSGENTSLKSQPSEAVSLNSDTSSRVRRESRSFNNIRELITKEYINVIHLNQRYILISGLLTCSYIFSSCYISGEGVSIPNTMLNVLISTIMPNISIPVYGVGTIFNIFKMYKGA